MHGHGVLTFHIPFIIAAMALGGPTAGALVAMLSTIERRELREVPWYGTLANHAALTFSAVIGGVVLLVIDARLVDLLPDKPQAVELIAIVAGGALMSVIVIGIVAGDRASPRRTVAVGGGAPVRHGVPGHGRHRGRPRLAARVHLQRSSAGGPRSSARCSSSPCGRANDDREIARHDAMTGSAESGWLRRAPVDGHRCRAARRPSRRRPRHRPRRLQVDQRSARARHGR